VIAVAVLAVLTANLAAQQQQQQPAPIQGQLVKVDTQAKTLDVMTADKKTVLFQYTDDTKVSGAQESMAGLATAKNVNVTVRFTEKGSTRIATEIAVQAARQE
jgi:hypothetical protein